MTGSRRATVGLAWLPPALYVALIWWLSSQVLELRVPVDIPMRDKVIHFFEYAFLGALISRAVHVTWGSRGGRSSMFALILSISLGLLDELHQLFVPGRSGEILDLVADGAGVCVAVALHALWTSRTSQTSVFG